MVGVRLAGGLLGSPASCLLGDEPVYEGMSFRRDIQRPTGVPQRKRMNF